VKAGEDRRDSLRTWVRTGCTRIEAAHAGTRLDRYLATRFRYRSRTQWGHLIREGRMTVNGRAVRPARLLRAGDRIDYVPLRRPEPPVDRDCPILHADAWLVGAAKSGDLPMHPSGRYFHHTLLHLLLAGHPEWRSLLIVHRLDRETSGAVVFGRTREAAAALARQFRERTVVKRYLALVEGRPGEDLFVIDLPLGPALDSRIRKAVGVRPDGVPARTRVQVLHRGEGWAWIEARPETGRLHQIRVHLRACGLPILGDKVYGRDERLFLKFAAGQPYSPQETSMLGLPRQALHAWQLRVHHPGTGAPLTLTAPLPPDLAGALALRGLDPVLALPPVLDA
jgi:RluA family pseudouridine synthase